MSEEHQAPPPAADDAGAAVEKWFGDKFPGSIVARDTSAYEHLRTVVDELKSNPVGIDQLFADKIQGSAVAQNVDAYNYVRNAFDELKERLKSRG